MFLLHDAVQEDGIDDSPSVHPSQLYFCQNW